MSEEKVAVKDLASLSSEAFMELIGGIYEKSPWVAEALFDVLKQDPTICASVTALHAAMEGIVNGSDMEKRLELINNHPDLAGRAALAGGVTAESKQEQARAGLSSLTEEELGRFTSLNEQYKAKFGFVFILAVRNASKYTILEAFARRINNSNNQEFDECMTQIHKIAWMRLLQKLKWNPVGFLTCHVLDTAKGCPAAGMRVALSRVEPTGSTVIAEFVTNADGRTGSALAGEAFAPGFYEWTFYCGSYFAKAGLYTTGTPFLDEVPIRFGIDNPEDHYHVPLLVSPWSFSTYRGS